jgi:hypothetical protein
MAPAQVAQLQTNRERKKILHPYIGLKKLPNINNRESAAISHWAISIS